VPFLKEKKRGKDKKLLQTNHYKKYDIKMITKMILKIIILIKNITLNLNRSSDVTIMTKNDI
jgi:hypothetical protein